MPRLANNVSSPYVSRRARALGILGAAGVMALCFSAAAATWPLTLEVVARDGYGAVTLKRPQPNTLVVPISIKGRNLNVVVDTGFGADGIVLDSDLSSLGPGGVAESVEIGNVLLKIAPVYFGKYPGLAALRHLASVDGFLTNGFLRTNSAIVDLHNSRLYIRPPQTGRAVRLGPALERAGLVEAPFSISSQGQCLVDVEINGQRGKMILATGAFLSGVDRRFASAVKGTGDRGLRTVDVNGAQSSSALAATTSFKIGGISIHPPELTLNTYPFFSSSGGKEIGLLGIDILGQNWSIIDFGQQKIYFAQGH
jgi:predicted aspartyl protease